MREILNTLYVQTQETVLNLENDTVRVRLKGETKLRAPLLRLSGIVVFGNVTLTPFLIHRCAQDGRTLVWLTQHGRFKARVQGPIRGNVLLRHAQHRAIDDDDRCVEIARQIVAAKIQNSRNAIMRSARDADRDKDRAALSMTEKHLAEIVTRLPYTQKLNGLRGAEGEAARAYFGAFSAMIRQQRNSFQIIGRNRRPPRDPMNALLSFLYAILRGECESAAETVGLDPQMGFLHSLRPGRPALALDLMEELRPVLADRLALTLVNRRQIKPSDFDEEGGAVLLNEDGRRTVLTAYQERKAVETRHRAIDRKIPLGLVPHVQAQLLARHLRGDIKHYPPFVHR